MNNETALAPTTVEVWSRDSILYTDHPARIVGPWPPDQTKTLLQLGESGPGLYVAAATVAGRYVVSLPVEPAAYHTRAAELHALMESIGAFEPMVDPKVSEPVPIEVKQFLVPVGILYAGPPCEWAQQELAKVFGKNAATMSHAEATDEQKAAGKHAQDGEHFIVYVGMIDASAAADDFEAIEQGLDAINNPLFIGTVTPTIEQIEQAMSRRDIGLAILNAPPEV